MRYPLWLILFSILLPLNSSANTPEKPAILVVGDSLSAAYGIAHKSGWVSLLQRRLTEKGYPHRVINASVSGDTTSAGLARLPRAIRTHQPTIVILELGGNDGLRGLPLTHMQQNLAKMITQIKAANAKVLLCAVRIPPNLGPDYATKFLATYTQLATKHDIPLVPYLLKGVSDAGLMQKDGIHPTAQAQPFILNNVWPQLELLLR